MTAPGYTVWLTGLSGAGKTTTAHELGALLEAEGRTVVHLDGDDLRRGLSSDLDFSAAGRDEAVRRAGAVARLLAQQGLIAIVAMVSPRAVARDAVKADHHEAGLFFAEIYLATPLTICEERDPKQLYAEARRGSITQFTGVSDPYEEPTEPAIAVTAHAVSPRAIALAIRSILPM
jgi:bifunctional enzyme CysN/CysC